MNYTREENTLQLISLLKKHSIRKVVVSPGNTNITFVGSVQSDPFFKVYSCIDERTATYMACGLAAKSGEPVVISCTGATAARNYPAGLTEAFYRNLPILALTSSQHFGRTGHMFPQFTDRNVRIQDATIKTFQVPYPYTREDSWSNNCMINEALLELKANKPSPVHINIETIFSHDFNVKVLPDERLILKYESNDSLPQILAKSICIFVGAHPKFSKELESAIDVFCEKYNAMVFCDPTSNYKGQYRVFGSIVSGQLEYKSKLLSPDLVIHIGSVSGSYTYFSSTKIWRVNEDGQLRDSFKLLDSIFALNELDFFNYYNKTSDKSDKKTEMSYYKKWCEEISKLMTNISEIPFSNVWVSQQTSGKLPHNSVLHLGILNSLRSWSIFDVPDSVYSYSNVGGFGIDGPISTTIGAALVDQSHIHYCVLGDLATFYDISFLGTQNISNNLRIIVVNNGTGFEMHCAGSIGSSFKYDEADKYFAAGKHNGNKSDTVLKSLVESFGFEYKSIKNKNDYLESLDYLIDPNSHDKPLVFEVFVDERDEEYAYNLIKKTFISNKSRTIAFARKFFGEKNFNKIKEIIKKIMRK